MLVTGATGGVPTSCAELLCAVFLISRSSSEWGVFQESFPGFGVCVWGVVLVALRHRVPLSQHSML